MQRPQYGVFAEGTMAHQHLELALSAGADEAALRVALNEVRVLGTNHRANGGANLVMGFGADAWRQLSGEPIPASLLPFPGYGDGERRAPATQRDIWLWVHGPGPDVVFDVALGAVTHLEAVADLAFDQPCWVYHNSRDLIGFVDGTANPLLDEAPDSALVPDGEEGAGGSHALTMRWVHDLQKFNALPVPDQERAIGRTKGDSTELDEDAMAPDAHLARVELESDDGEELEIYRRSVPFGTVAEHGLMFVGFSADPKRFDMMLTRMFGMADDGRHDQVTNFSTPTTGSYWFVPSVTDLVRVLGDPPDPQG